MPMHYTAVVSTFMPFPVPNENVIATDLGAFVPVPGRSQNYNNLRRVFRANRREVIVGTATLDDQPESQRYVRVVSIKPIRPDIAPLR